MIDFICGKLAAGGSGWAVLEVQGIGFYLHVPAATRLPALGQEIKLYAHMAVREDGIQLYGFADQEQRDCFLALLNVAGVGPKVALAVVSHLPPGQLQAVIAGGDVHQLVKVPGVGKKTAQRILLELKDKLAVPVVSAGTVVPQDTAGSDLTAEDAVIALVSLGYAQTEAREAVGRVQTKAATKDVSTLIKEALKVLAPIK
ncbi:Holliday junction branch migration protein RuvA [Desulforamulus hydrothermalis]|uniref:Holliday junction branch migration complex subunit RuvA n=1 Tax=Desulforamulus hydrothermalis Lam5 = DSM 18033 TaxID=1121428 RepID=K8DXH4_9FIRM|nr:Holliday junction branch migration protein RuvA [Desulforamulus hydrothermalis]CCO07230.1 Holliday junction ATP-dependent DNA helicase RuvA [Desulforamulus hydrothermalis Lam5 = DSM 18033]SHG87508.1 Holliday junction DNA helicase subunit RuvA [Desulforamulus hydrothermalis Lam5 = DSM 18033]